LIDLIPITDWFSNILIVILISDETPYQQLGLPIAVWKNPVLALKYQVHITKVPLTDVNGQVMTVFM
jgi:hypothetical protein